MNEVLSIIRAEMFDIFKSDRVEKRIRGAFEYHIRMACDQRRNSRSLREAMKFFEDKDRISGPLADLGITTRDPSDFIPPPKRPAPPEPIVKRSSAPPRGQDPFKRSPQPSHKSQTSGTSSTSQTTSRTAKRKAPLDDDSRPATKKDFVMLLRDALVNSINPSPPSASPPTPPNSNIQ